MILGPDSPNFCECKHKRGKTITIDVFSIKREIRFSSLPIPDSLHLYLEQKSSPAELENSWNLSNGGKQFLILRSKLN